MGTVHFDHPTWLTMRGSLALQRRKLPSATRSDTGLVLRTLGLAALAAALALGAVTGGVFNPGAAGLFMEGSGTGDGKDASRLDLGDKRATQVAAPAISELVTPTGGKESAGLAAPQPTLDGDSRDQAPSWLEEEFAAVKVVDGRTLSAGAVTIRLDGLELPHREQVCRTLDNRLEPCASRAATQLELLTRSRTVACRYRMTTSSEATGSCRIGPQDLAERLLRTGYVRASETGSPVVTSALPSAPAPR
jgi:endonuclease YncB( thermonuclease family)